MESKWLMYVLLTLFLLDGQWGQGCWDQERTALLQLKPFFHSTPFLRNWEEGEENSDCCQWEGVECNSTTGRVITLNLNSTWFPDYPFQDEYYVSIEGDFKSENPMYLNASLFLPFEELRSLHLARNGIAGCIENEGFFKLSKKLRNLETLNLEGNLFDKSILPSLSELSSLRSLNLCDNRFQTSNHANGFKMLSKLRNLEILDLRYNWLNNSVLSSLSELQPLKSLNLMGNKLQASNHANGFERLSNLKNLEILDLNYNMLNNSILSSLSELPSLKSLYLAGNKFQASNHDDGFRRLSKLRNLEILDIGHNMLNNSILSSLSELPSLKSLYLAGNKFQASNHDDGFERLSKLRNLEILDLSYNMLNNCTLSSLGELSSLTFLNLAQSNLLASNYGFLKLSKKLSNLEILNLEGNFFNNSILSYLSEFSSLKSLYLADNELQAYDLVDGFKRFSKLRKLEMLDLSYNVLNNSVLSSLSELLSLKFLYLAEDKFQASSHADAEFEKLSRLSHLEVLDLSGINFSYNILSYLASLPSLKILFLGGGRIQMNPSTRGFHNLSKVEELFMEHCILPTNFIQGIGALPSLKVLSLSGSILNGSLTGQGLCELTNLQGLDVGYNYLGGALPSCLANLTSLQILSLDSNEFSGDIALSPLNKLTSLYYLSLSDNHFQIPISLQPFFNHSKLKHIYAENNEFYVDTNIESLEPTFQLHNLVLSGYGDCQAIPDFLFSQHDLETIDLEHLNLTGEFPIWLLENNTKLWRLSLVNNALSGPIGSLAHSHKSLNVLDISKNFLDGHIPMEIGASLPSLGYLKISRNSLTGSIPPSVGDMKLLVYLDLSHNNLSDGIPEKLTLDCSSLQILRLSNNNLQGQIFSEKFNLFQLEELHLDSNNFSGSVPKSLSNCSYLISIDFSKNNLSGRIPSWMGNMSYLQYIIMPNNGLNGPIPMEFCQLQYLEILDLSNNNISGSMPACFSPRQITQVHLSKNCLEGSLTTQFCNSTYLVTLDLSDNQLSGNIPDCINRLGELSYLILKNNNLEGKIPIQLCKLQKLSLIDLSHNHLSGSMPSCLNITPFNEAYNGNYVALSTGLDHSNHSLRFSDEPVHFTTKNMPYSYRGKILTYMSGIDLSCNKLIGKIPSKIGHLSKIRVLNLSHNILIGPIPSTFSNLVQIESLDLSYNNLSGAIPPQLVELYFLSIFSVAYNNLSGKIPARVKQFATFDESCYQGNPLLCGEPMKSCSAPSPPPLMPKGPIQSREENGLIDIEVFYVSFIVSYIMVLITIAAVLYINPYWRRAWFYYTEMCFNSCYYFVVDHLPKQLH